MGDYSPSYFFGQQSYIDPYSPYTVQSYSGYSSNDTSVYYTTLSQSVVFAAPEQMVVEEAPRRAPINEADYAFPDPTPVLDPEERPPTITSLPKDGQADQAQLDRWKRIKQNPVPKANVPPPNLISCSKCKAQKEDSTLKCSNAHILCLECAAAVYLGGKVECPTCQVGWTMLQILHAHFVICGETMPAYHLERPKDIRIPKDGIICIGENRHLAEKLEEGKEIAFPELGHLTYNRNRAMEACPNDHILCKPCALRLVTTGDKKCPTCKAVLNYQDDQPAACEDVKADK